MIKVTKYTFNSPINIIRIFTVLCVLSGTDIYAQKKDVPSDSSATRTVNVFYLHTYKRCYSCKMIEKITREAINTHFRNELRNGTLTYKLINIEIKENNHLITDYKLITKSIIVSEVMNGNETRWKNLDKIWQLLQNHPEFKKYIKNEINMYLDK